MKLIKTVIRGLDFVMSGNGASLNSEKEWSRKNPMSAVSFAAEDGLRAYL